MGFRTLNLEAFLVVSIRINDAAAKFSQEKASDLSNFEGK